MAAQHNGDGVEKYLGPVIPGKLSLEAMREDLIRMEETIIFSLIERAQFKRNDAIYQPRAVTDKFDETFLDYFLIETERVHSRMRRYTSPDEHAFFPDRLVSPSLPLLSFPAIVKPNKINYNHKVKTLYLEKIIPSICKSGDDNQYGSAAQADIIALQAISKRVHYGKFVAESKFQENPQLFAELIRNKYAAGIEAALVNKSVEQRLLERVHRKASTYGREISTAGVTEEQSPIYKVEPSVIVSLYKDFLIPLTIEIEVAYLLERLEKPLVAFLGPEATFSHQAALAYFNGSASGVGAAEDGGTASVDFIPVPTIAGVFDAVLSNRATYGVVPVENSIAGRVQQTMELLYDTQVKLIGELYIPITHHLLARVGADRKQITKVHSHKQALMQCGNWLKTNLPRAQPQDTNSTAKAAQLVAEGSDDSAAAIASELAAHRFGLAIIEKAIQDAAHNFTRFLVLGKQIGAPSGKDKTVLTFGTKHQTGALAAAINAFSAYGLNLLALESFPHKTEPWQYNFFVEIEGHPADDAIQKALGDLREVSTFVHVIGGFARKERL